MTKQNEVEITREFFQLFKTPWEFFTDAGSYDIVITTGEPPVGIKTKLLIIYNSEDIAWDTASGITSHSIPGNVSLSFNTVTIPIYGRIQTFYGGCTSLVTVTGTNNSVGIEINTGSIKCIRIGYDLFKEADILLTKGQPVENALIPTLELHIALLKTLITGAGLLLVEIPPVPAGYAYSACLTHDIDFIRIRDHIFTHAILGFLLRATFSTVKKVVTNKISISQAWRNVKAVLSLPFVLPGLAKDFWFQFESYKEIEKNLCATWFVSPYKNKRGENIDSPVAARRATSYDVDDIKDIIEKLTADGDEVGVHGIDAWHSSEKGRMERKRIEEITKASHSGVRIHWLCQNEHTARNLDKAGYSYDSSCGYNDTPGYRAGTTQVFIPKGSKNMLELPMHIQDTALFFPSYMNLPEPEAFALCKQFIDNALRFGGVLTILWHQRSLAPERLWGNTYIKFLEEIKIKNVWFGTARQVTKWFEKRRTAAFKSVRINDNTVSVTTSCNNDRDALPPLQVRLYLPAKNSKKDTFHSPDMNYIDTPLIPNQEMHITF